MIACFYQVFTPRSDHDLPRVGRCTVCTPDEKNRECRLFFPVSVTIMEARSAAQP